MSQKPLFALLAALLVALGVSACSPTEHQPGASAGANADGTAEVTASPEAPSTAAAEPVVNPSATPGDQESIRTQPGGGTLTFTGEFSDTVSFQSTYCLLFDGKLFNFQAPAEARYSNPDGWVINGDMGKVAFGRSDDLTGGTILKGVSVDGTTLTFDKIDVTVSVDMANKSAILSGTLTCSDIEE